MSNVHPGESSATDSNQTCRRPNIRLPPVALHENVNVLHPVSTRNSLQSLTGDFLPREAVNHELELKHQWVETKRVQEASEAQDDAVIEPQSCAERHVLSSDNSDTRVDEAADPELVEWLEDDPENPKNFSFGSKMWITLLTCVLTVNVTFASSAPSSAVGLIAESFKVSREAADLITSIFLCGYITGPIIWAPASELFGRRPVFVGTILLYTLFQLGQTLGQNFGTVIVTRFLAGLFASAPIANCGGLVVDIWGPVGRGHAMSIISASIFIGPVLGPIVGGFISDSYLGWRWIFWVMMIFGGVCWILFVLFLPETYSPVLLAKRAHRLRKKNPQKNGHKYALSERMDFSPRAMLERTVYRPFIMLSQEPILVLITIYLSVVYGLLYALFSVFPIIWGQLRGFNASQSGLIFIGVGLGACIGAALNIYLQQSHSVLARKWHGSPPPEERLPGGMIAGPFLVISIFWLGWTGAYRSVPWYVPALATIPLGMSFTLIFIAFMTYIVDTYLLFSASALAANTVFRSAVGAAFPLFTSQMFSALGVQWACTLIGGITIFLLPIPFVFYKFGPTIRERSKFAPCIDIKIREQVKREEAEILKRERKEIAGQPTLRGDLAV